MAVLKAKLVEAKLKELHGNMAGVARFFGVTRGAVWNYVRRRPKLVQILVDEREGLKDHAESVVMRAVVDGDLDAAKWYLKCQARDRGYYERLEHSTFQDEDIDHAIERHDENVRQKTLRGTGGAVDARGKGGSRPPDAGTGPERANDPGATTVDPLPG